MSENHEVMGETRLAGKRGGDAGKVTFGLLSEKAAIVARGVRQPVTAGPVSTLAGRLSAFFATVPDGPRIVVGAIPFDRAADDFVFQPEAIDFGGDALPKAQGRRTIYPAATGWLVTPEPDAAAYGAAVRAALSRMQPTSGLRKVVLSRSLSLAAGAPIDIDGLLASLAADRSVTTFLTRLPPSGDVPRVLAGATPELLVAKSGGEVVSHPLAGSARRQSDPLADREAAAALKSSDKDQREHRAVVEAVLDALNPYCRELSAPDTEALVTTATMWHLGTRVVGKLKDPSTSAAELVAALHPTPAVCGLPRERAAGVIRELETYDRGFYAGAVGWTGESGDGQWFVSLRCAEVAGSRARLYAGAGIVPGSDPASEVDETSAKFLAMLKALGVDEQGRAMAGRAA